MSCNLFVLGDEVVAGKAGVAKRKRSAVGGGWIVWTGRGICPRTFLLIYIVFGTK